MQDRLEYAERRLEEEIKNGEMCDIQYWRGYRDAAKALTREKEMNQLMDNLRKIGMQKEFRA